MGRPPGRTKTARISVSFEPDIYGALVVMAKRQDVPVAQIIRRAVAQLVAPNTTSNISLADSSAETARGGV